MTSERQTVVAPALNRAGRLGVKSVRFPATAVRIFDFYLVAIGPWVVAGTERQ